MSRRDFAERAMEDVGFLSEWGLEYASKKDQAIARVLGDAALLARFRSGRRLPRGFGFALDERIVELPWAVAMEPTGKVLDAGSALNHRVVLERLLPTVESLTITTFTPESEEEPNPGPDYTAADLRDLPFAEGEFDTVVSVSTLEHVGMDNSGYGSEESRSDDPEAEMRRALLELWRVLRPGGRMLLTVPYGRPEDHGWLRQLDRAGIERLLGWCGPAEQSLRIYRYTAKGWQRSGLRRAAKAHYRDHQAEPMPDRDCAFAARAVACIEVTRDPA
jgi:SAM-dependent methyltransferase